MLQLLQKQWYSADAVQCFNSWLFFPRGKKISNHKSMKNWDKQVERCFWKEKSTNTLSLQTLIGTEGEKRLEANREVLSRLIDLTVVHAGLGKSFRGDSISSNNRGNILQLVDVFYGRITYVFLWQCAEMHLENVEWWVMSLSDRSQSDIIAVLDVNIYIRRQVQSEIKEAEMYSIVLDGTVSL